MGPEMQSCMKCRKRNLARLDFFCGGIRYSFDCWAPIETDVSLQGRKHVKGRPTVCEPPLGKRVAARFPALALKPMLTERRERSDEPYQLDQ